MLKAFLIASAIVIAIGILYFVFIGWAIGKCMSRRD